ncbi:hypothetical protein KC678_05760 [Candidatus Dojkabacteria bacterium]|uniref:Uncharacterized protein n=1 Tax=Candidatus Dojkabacteria bacterium TaxID=2099670 RepID=A0A955RH94_9BACT|nr:hypothetical protein [Candidatus Dojkabacteria bacterium]
MNKFRKWRVQTFKKGMKAPSFIVETMEEKEWEAIISAKKLAFDKSILISKYNFDFRLELL